MSRWIPRRDPLVPGSGWVPYPSWPWPPWFWQARRCGGGRLWGLRGTHAAFAPLEVTRPWQKTDLSARLGKLRKGELKRHSPHQNCVGGEGWAGDRNQQPPSPRSLPEPMGGCSPRNAGQLRAPSTPPPPAQPPRCGEDTQPFEVGGSPAPPPPSPVSHLGLCLSAVPLPPPSRRWRRGERSRGTAPLLLREGALSPAPRRRGWGRVNRGERGRRGGGRRRRRAGSAPGLGARRGARPGSAAAGGCRGGGEPGLRRRP